MELRNIEELQGVVVLLNNLLKADPEAISLLFSYRVKTNTELIDCQHVIVGHDDKLSVLGVLNGILNKLQEDQVSQKRVARVMSDEGEITGFSIVTYQGSKCIG